MIVMYDYDIVIFTGLAGFPPHAWQALDIMTGLTADQFFWKRYIELLILPQTEYELY